MWSFYCRLGRRCPGGRKPDCPRVSPFPHLVSGRDGLLKNSNFQPSKASVKFQESVETASDSSVEISSFLYQPLHITLFSFPTWSVFPAETPRCPLCHHPQENSPGFALILCSDTTFSTATRSLFFLCSDLLECSTNMNGQHAFNNNNSAFLYFPGCSRIRFILCLPPTNTEHCSY